MMKCPKCKTPMIVIERKGIELDHCIDCLGVWFDSGELELFFEAHGVEHGLPDIEALPAVSSDEQKRRCPRCRKKMDKIHLGKKEPLLIDRCVIGDGIWFDFGELDEVVEFYAEGGAGEINSMLRYVGNSVKEMDFKDEDKGGNEE